METINKLYLELSQVTTATTAKEFELRRYVESLEGKCDFLAKDNAELRAEVSRLRSGNMTYEAKTNAIRSLVER